MLSLVLLSLIWTASAFPDDLFLPRIENGDSLNDGYRLLTTARPSRYDINLIVPPESLSGGATTYSGSVRIVFQMTESTNIIRLNSLVNILNVSLADSSSVTITNYTVDSTLETLTILTSSNISTNVNYTLEIFYNAVLEPVSMKGFYRSEYIINGIKEYLGTTQFQPTYARKAFPCFDEPQYKAVFGLTITHPSEFTAVANTLQESSSNTGTTMTTIFKDSPVMSTYLLAFTLSKFTCTQDTVSTTIPYAVCSRPDLASDRNLATTYGRRMMTALDNWTNYSYSQMGLGKMDQFALPDFDAGAMENWGLVTYREWLLLWSQEYTSNIYKQRILAVIAHEFAHMWFGNLVTTRWWSSTFLNEGFARYFQYFLLNMINDLEDFQIEKQFVIEQQQTAFIVDSYLSSSSLTSNAWTPSQIHNKFSTISYNKGASVIRMVENFIGTTAFQTGLQKYLANNAYSTTTPKILWDTLSGEVSAGTLPNGLNLTQVLDNWTYQAGFPFITATLSGDNIILTQERFLYNGTDSTQWYVPISYIISNRIINNSTLWLEPHGNVTLQNALDNNGWIIINHNATGYYRVNYDNTLRSRLAAALHSDHSKISEIDRAQILDDALNLARAGHIKYSEAFQLLQYLEKETSYFPWYVAIRGLNYVIVRMGNNSILGQSVASTLLKYIENISANVSTTNWNTVDHITSLKLQLVWKAACRLGQTSCISEVKRLFRELRVNGTSINPNIRDVVYCNAIRYSDNITRDWNFLWNRLNSIDQPHETLYILLGLGCARSEDHLLYYLKQSMNNTSVIRIQDMDTVWSAVYSSSSVGLQIALEYFIDNHEAILSYFPDGVSLLSGIADIFTTEAHVNQLQNFVNQQAANSTIGKIGTSALQSARKNLQWQMSIKSDLEEYFGINPSSAFSLGSSMCLVLLAFFITL